MRPGGPHSGLGSLVFLLLLTAPPVASQDLAPLLKAQTVTIAVSRTTEEGDEDLDTGTGVILCQDDDQAYILTARHVLFGKGVAGRRTPGLKDLSQIRISFFKNIASPVLEDRTREEELITIQQPGRKWDILLLTLPVQEVLPVTAALGVAPASNDLGGKPLVYSVGYKVAEKEQGESWTFEEGSLLQRGPELLHHSIPITEGFSGGPLFNEAGALIGINFEINNSVEPGAELSGVHSHALPIEQVVKLIDKWLPAVCLKSADPLREIAYGTYRRAMRAVSTKNWREAAKLMREAIEQLPVEGGSVHLQGMRYTKYLPRYHLGLALFRQNESHCGEALREWGRSEVQGAIKDDKRYRKLRRYRERCRETLRENLQSVPGPGSGGSE